MSEQVNVVNENLRERRLRLLEIHRRGVDVVRLTTALAVEYGVSYWGLVEDWKVRARWLPGIVDVGDVELVKASLVDEFDAVLRECWDGVLKSKAAESWSAYNGCLKNLREVLVARGEFLQSLGVVPRMASEVKFEHDKVEVKVPVDRSDSEVLSAAARILDKKEGCAKQSDGLH